MKVYTEHQYPDFGVNNNKKSNSFHADSTSIIFDNGLVAGLSSQNKNAIKLFNCLKDSISESWFHDLQSQSKIKYEKSICNFINWLNEQPEIGLNILNDYQSYEIEKKNKKLRNCQAHSIKSIIKRRMDIIGTDLSLHVFENRLLSSCRLDLGMDDTSSIDLTHWASQCQWLRKKLGSEYMKIESPKRLHSSFRNTIAELLIILLKARKEFSSNENLMSVYSEASRNYSSTRRKSLTQARAFDEYVAGLGGSSDSLFTLLFLDGIRPHNEHDISKKMKRNKEYSFQDELCAKNKGYPFTNGLFFKDGVSEVEQLLAYWLLVSQTVQPSDAQNITKKNIATKKNKFNQVTLLEVVYFKGRANRQPYTPMLEGSDVVARAILMYMEAIPEKQLKLFTHPKLGRNRHFVNPNNFEGTFYKKNLYKNTSTNLLLRVLSNEHFYSELCKKLAQRKVSNIFLKVLKEFLSPDILDSHNYASKFCKKYDQYKDEITHYLPSSLFTPTHVKNTSVYSRTEKYRDGDPVNQNSHTSATEKVSYVTDDNKEWKNQHGRLTRMVMDDIQLAAYKPSIELAETEIRERKLLTKIAKNTSTSNPTINKLGRVVKDDDYEDLPNYLVVESVETAIQMLYYIKESKKFGEQLKQLNHEFYINTLLVNVEWMYFCISKFCPKIIKEADEKLSRIANVLPRLFDNEIRSGV